MTEYLFDDSILEHIDVQSEKHSLAIKCDQAGYDFNRFVIRPLSKSDYNRDYIELMAQLTLKGRPVTKQMFEDSFMIMKSNPSMYFIVVIEDKLNDKTIASATLQVEYKFIRSCAKRGRIEDVIIEENFRKLGFGKYLLSLLTKLADYIGCYKCTLECKISLCSFYNKFGYVQEQDNLHLVRRMHLSNGTPNK